jgi:ubiquinone/menaquinone biosynthesis C-methylase UbiE
MNYLKSNKYTDYKKIYENCSGPGGLKLAEFMAEKMKLESGKRLIDIGFFKGYQTCFLAKEYNIDIIGIDPLDDEHISGGIPAIEHLMENAREFNVSDKILGIKTGVPETLLPSNYFDYAYCTTTLELIRGMNGSDACNLALKEIYRILKKGGILGLGDPMHFDTPIPDDLSEYIKNIQFDKCLITLEETKKEVINAGFTIIESNYCEDSNAWWKEYNINDPKPDDDETKLIVNNNNRWLSFGYVIAKK